MRFLLDTHTALWALFDPHRLSTAASDAVSEASNDILADIPQIASWFAEIIPPCHRRGNEIIFAAA